MKKAFLNILIHGWAESTDAELKDMGDQIYTHASMCNGSFLKFRRRKSLWVWQAEL
jgi:hypothetical protein